MTEEKENIVKRVCKELNITQKELSEILGVPQTTISGWATTKIPKMAELALNLLIENKTLKEKLEIFKKAHKIASEL
ncbi:TPA: helix-turn-helix transcriptional regulator [Campylobacter jejuni]|nr:helix-turn-helix transcriptional regulator [Campylobacter jejuni]ECP8551013.1 helix-turn-helix transcriptional regulator [Campylobacter jejuni]ECP8671319.1 helix-turn-helix transcriptional regulator [Campylobacter jejuni]ECP8881274.1 helix-turn-helix transcriptional regulator [Campylobacter jejuni]ECP9225330.1 helix-turn-helix transcriptional regulator [Campylobacter jejuni]